MSRPKNTHRVIKWTIATILGVFFIALSGVFLILLKPTLIFNEKNLELAARYSRSHKIMDIEWSKASVQVHSTSLFHKAFDFAFSDLCIKNASVEFQICFHTADFSLSAGVKGFSPLITDLGPAQFLGGRLEVNLLPQVSQANSSTDKGSPLLAGLVNITVHPFQILLDDITVKDGTSSYQGRGEIRAELESGHPLKVDSQLSATLFQMSKKLGNLKMTAHEEDSKFRASVGLLNWVIQPAQALSGSTDLSGTLKDNQLKLNGQINAKLKKPFSLPQTIQGSFHAEMLDLKRFDNIQLEISGVGRHLSPQLARVDVKDCRISLKRTQANAGTGMTTANCPVTLPVLDPPQIVHINLKTEMNSNEYPPSPSSDLKGWAQVEVKPFTSPWVDGSGVIKADLQGVPARFPLGWKADADLNVRLAVPKFEQLVEELALTGWAIPAPFHVLKGRIEAGIHGKTDLTHGELPVTLTSRLNSEHQRLYLDGKGAFTLSGAPLISKANLAFNLLLSDVKLELPRLDLKDPPRMVPDDRFDLPKKMKVGNISRPGFDFTYDIHVKSPDSSPLTILSTLANAPIPLMIDLDLKKDQPPQGSVTAARFPIKLFRRDATLQHFSVSLRNPTEESPIDGKITVTYTDYTISILIISTVGKPRVILTSDPPLPEDKLVATLLFGRPMEELDDDQNQSVGNTRAALADRAIGLASLFVLASTPVQSVGYDPKSGTLIAKVRIADGTSLNVGANSTRIEDIGIRKRLSSKWTLNTDLVHPTGDEATSLSTFLEWAHRY